MLPKANASIKLKQLIQLLKALKGFVNDQPAISNEIIPIKKCS